MKVKIYTDGSCRGNPGPSAGGWVILDMQNILIAMDSKYLGHCTNNQAEYLAVIYALEHALRLKAQDVLLLSDSDLLVNQINGKYAIKSPKLEKLHCATRELICKFRLFDAKHINREKNKIADTLANEEVERHLKENV